MILHMRNSHQSIRCLLSRNLSGSFYYHTLPLQRPSQDLNLLENHKVWEFEINCHQSFFFHIYLLLIMRKGWQDTRRPFDRPLSLTTLASMLLLILLWLYYTNDYESMHPSFLLSFFHCDLKGFPTFRRYQTSACWIERQSISWAATPATRETSFPLLG